MTAAVAQFILQTRTVFSQQESLITVDEYSCGVKGQFERTIAIYLEQDLVLDQYAAAINAIEQAIVLEYNQLALASCDTPSFRKVQSATVTTIDAAVGGSDVLSSKPFQVLTAIVRADCHGCGETIRLFNNENDNSISPDLPQDSILAVAKNMEGVEKQLGESCVCQAGAGVNPLLLTEANMKDALTANLGVAVAEVVELQELACPSTTVNFTSNVYMDVTLMGEKGEPNMIEVVALAQTFIDVYNGISLSNCDPFFRQISSATVEFITESDQDQNETRAVEFFTESDQDQNETRAFPANLTDFNVTDMNAKQGTEEGTEEEGPLTGVAVFKVNGECRSCVPDSSGSFRLFSDAIQRSGGRRRLKEKWRQSYSSLLRVATPGAGTCICPVSSVSGGPPNSIHLNDEEFMFVFNDELRVLQVRKIYGLGFLVKQFGICAPD